MLLSPPLWQLHCDIEIVNECMRVICFSFYTCYAYCACCAFYMLQWMLWLLFSLLRSLHTFFPLFIFFSDLVMAASAAAMASTTSIDIQTEMFETHICALVMWDNCRALNTLRNYKRLIEKWKMCFSFLSSLLHSILLGFDLLLTCFARYGASRKNSQTAS